MKSPREGGPLDFMLWKLQKFFKNNSQEIYKNFIYIIIGLIIIVILRKLYISYYNIIFLGLTLCLIYLISIGEGSYNNVQSKMITIFIIFLIMIAPKVNEIYNNYKRKQKKY